MQEQPEVKGEQTLEQFIQKLFQSEDIKTIANAREAIEKEFEVSFKPDRDLIGYLKYKRTAVLGKIKKSTARLPYAMMTQNSDKKEDA